MSGRFVLIGMLCLVQAFGFAQGQSLAKKKVTDGAASQVTHVEFVETFTRMERVISRVVNIQLGLRRLQPIEGPAKRSDAIARMDQIFEACKPRFKYMPRKISFDTKLLGLPTGHPQRPALEKLIRWGCIGRTTPLATSKQESLSVSELGDAVGLFILRIADITHRPDPKYSPIIGGG